MYKTEAHYYTICVNFFFYFFFFENGYPLSGYDIADLLSRVSTQILH